MIERLKIEESILYGNSKPTVLVIDYDYMCKDENDTLADICLYNEGSDNHMSISVSKANARLIIDKLQEMLDL